jgi:hypothetical protein
MIWFLVTFSPLKTVSKAMMVAIGVMALAIPEKAEDTWCPPKEKRTKGIAELKRPTMKQSIKNFGSLRIRILRNRRTMYKVVAPRTHRQKAKPMGESDSLANSIKKNDEPQIMPAPK